MGAVERQIAANTCLKKYVLQMQQFSTILHMYLPNYGTDPDCHSIQCDQNDLRMVFLDVYDYLRPNPSCIY